MEKQIKLALKQEKELNEKLVKKSIKKWEGIVFHGGEDHGRNDCALCLKYVDGECDDCPVFVYTGMPECQDTPYMDWWQHLKKKHPKEKRKIHCKRCEKLAKKELKFLKNLLEEMTIEQG